MQSRLCASNAQCQQRPVESRKELDHLEVRRRGPCGDEKLSEKAQSPLGSPQMLLRNIKCMPAATAPRGLVKSAQSKPSSCGNRRQGVRKHT